MSDGARPRWTNGVFSPDPGSQHEEGGLEREKAQSGRAGDKMDKRTYSQIESLNQTPDLIERAGLEWEQPIRDERKVRRRLIAKRSLESRPAISAREGGVGT